MRALERRIRHGKNAKPEHRDSEERQEDQKPHPNLCKNADTRVGHPFELFRLRPQNLNKSIRLPMAGAFRGTEGWLLGGDRVGQIIAAAIAH